MLPWVTLSWGKTLKASVSLGAAAEGLSPRFLKPRGDNAVIIRHQPSTRRAYYNQIQSAKPQEGSTQHINGMLLGSLPLCVSYFPSLWLQDEMGHHSTPAAFISEGLGEKFNGDLARQGQRAIAATKQGLSGICTGRNRSPNYSPECHCWSVFPVAHTMRQIIVPH